jgi:hypothetical protein
MRYKRFQALNEANVNRQRINWEMHITNLADSSIAQFDLDESTVGLEEGMERKPSEGGKYVSLQNKKAWGKDRKAWKFADTRALCQNGIPADLRVNIWSDLLGIRKIKKDKKFHSISGFRPL